MTMRMRLTAMILVLLLAALTGVTPATSSPTPPTVPCDEVIDYAKSGHEGGYRLVLGVISVPPAYLRQVVPTHSQPWAYWRKAGLVVHAGSAPVSVSVPKPWRNRVAITWGNSTGVVSGLRIAGCASPPNVWRAYSGGFYLRSRSACVPLIFRVGQRSTTIRFGVGRSCGAAG